MRMRKWLLFTAAVAGSAAAVLFTAGGEDTTAPELSDQAQQIYMLASSTDPFDRLAQSAILGGLDAKYYEDGADISFGCLDYGEISLLIHPDTEPEQLARALERLKKFYDEQAGPNKEGYNASGRWTVTATDASTGSTGDPITLTWGYVPDGTFVPSLGTTSSLYAVFDAGFPNPSVWKNKINNAFSRWTNAIGTTYIYEPNDDMANHGSSPGILGVRPDCRIAGGSVDGQNGVLAYNYYPNNGDMVIDTDDLPNYLNPIGNYTFLKNVVMHEHGHGMGLGHTIPSDQTKLMEPFANTAFLGPQDDDLRGSQRLYGDIYENNDTAPTATVLGALAEPDTFFSDVLSIDRGSDEDYYRVTLSDPDLEITVDPLGSTYLLANEGGSPSSVSTDSISDPDVELYESDGTTLVASATSGGLGETEVLNAAGLPAGDYVVKVFRKSGTGNNIQRYSLQLVPKSPATNIASGELPVVRELGVQVAPNPFNPLTKVRFLAPAAGEYNVDVYDPSGRLVRRINGRSPSAGPVEVSWNGRTDSGTEAASGLYLMRVTAGRLAETKRALLVR